MAYVLIQFGGTSVGAGTYITLYAIESLPVGADPTLSGIVRLAGGRTYDAIGTGQSDAELPRTIEVPVRLTAATAGTLETNIDTLNLWSGKRDLLWVRNKAGTVSRFRPARLMGVDLRSVPSYQTWVTGRLYFELATAGWSGADLSTGGIALDTNPHDVVATNGGNRPVDDAIITLIAGANDITAVTFAVTGVSSITWTGTLLGLKSLEIDCGERTVLNDGADARSGLVLNAAHTISPWLRLAASASTTMIVTWTGGGLPTCYIGGLDAWY